MVTRSLLFLGSEYPRHHSDFWEVVTQFMLQVCGALVKWRIGEIVLLCTEVLEHCCTVLQDRLSR